MSLFPSPAGDYNRKRPRRGISLLLEIFTQEFFHIAGVNALFVLCSIPVFTMPGAYAAMTRVNGHYVQEQPCNQWKEFFRTFREEWKRSLPIGLILLLAPLMLALISFELMTNMWNAVHYLLLTGSLVSAALLLLIRYYFFPLLTWTHLSVSQALRNAFMLSVIQLWPNLLMLAFHAVLFCVVVYFFPMSTPYLALCVFGSVNLAATFTAWIGIRRYVLTDSDQEETI